ncbi:MAG: thioredoxin family protein [Deltaproteobacteria bacterium]|nr:thioredoxin family protein [Deltaproteobacteria bacterium]
MGLIDEKDAAKLAQIFSGLPHEVRIVYFTQEHECAYCKTTREILTELCALSDKLELEVLDFVADRARAEEYGVDKIPATALMGAEDYGIRFYGVPAGYEFTALVEGIIDVGRRSADLPEPLLAELRAWDRPVHLQVAVSPTCPYCPAAVRAAHSLALMGKSIRADMVEISEFPHLAVKYGVQGVPHTVIEEVHSVVGAMPPAELFERIKEALA